MIQVRNQFSLSLSLSGRKAPIREGHHATVEFPVLDCAGHANRKESQMRSMPRVVGMVLVLGLLGMALLAVPAGAAPFAYITNLGSNNVSVIDTASNSVTATIPVCCGPSGVAVNPAGTRVYVVTALVSIAGSSVLVIDTASNSVMATIPVGSAPANGVAVNPAGTRVYVANFSDNNVSVIDTASNSVTATIPVCCGPSGVAVNPAGTRVYVANAASDSVSVIDTASNSVMATIPVGSAPFSFGQFIMP